MEFIVVLIILEIFEVYWQRGKDIQEYVYNMFKIYHRSILLFICMHPSFYFLLFSQIYFQNFSLLASSITVIKALDISFKLSLMDKIEKGNNLGIYEIILRENREINPFLKLLGVILYPLIYYFAYFS